MTAEGNRAQVQALRRSGASVSDIASRTGVPRSTVGRWIREVEPDQQPSPPASVEPPADVADRATWLRDQLADAVQRSAGEGPTSAAWARHSLALRDALDETEADVRKALEAAGKAAEPDPVAVARSILDVLPQLARQIPRTQALQIYSELGKVLGVVEEEG